MAATIVSRTISSVIDQKIVLDGTSGNKQIGRTMTIGSNWNQLRVVARLSCDPTGNTGDFVPDFTFGVCSGTTNMYGSATTTNWLGGLFRAGIAWTFFGGNLWVQSGGAPLNLSKRVGTTTTTLSLGLSSMYCSGSPTTWRSYVSLDIVKGSPNYTVTLMGYQTLAANDTTTATLYSLLLEPSAPVGNVATVAFDETAGALDTINFYWGTTTRKLEISEVIVYRKA